MKNIFAFLFLMLYSITGSAQNKQQKFEQSVAEIMQCLAKDDLETINKKYVHPVLQIFVLYRIGVPDVFYRTKALRKDSIYSSPYFYTASLPMKKRQLKLASVYFDCNNERWTKNGFFYQRSVPHLLSNIVDFQKQYESMETEQKILDMISTIEGNSYRVVDTESNVVFYLTWIGDHWYLTVFDLVSMDCSA